MDEKLLEMIMNVNDVITYAIYQNGLHIVRDITIKNNSQNEYENIILKITSDSELIVPYECGIQKLQAEEEMVLSDVELKLKGDYLASLTERVSCVIKAEIYVNDECIVSEHKNIVALAYDEWPGLKYFPDFLAAFVTPNHPVVADLLKSTSKWLEKWTKEPSLEGYQCQDPNRVKKMAAAAYAAIQERNITYANPPSSFEEMGQRVRLCDTVMDQRLGTCMDMTLLYVSVLEAIGLNPVLVLISGHIFAGVWLVDQSFADPLVDDPSQLEKRMANGINEFIVVECTAMCSGKTHSFETAIKIAKNHVAAYSEFLFAIDVLRARRSGVRPLPMRIMEHGGYVIAHEDRKEKDVTNRPDEVGYILNTNEISTKNEVTKQTQWERKLLDLSMRNMLINMRLTKAVVPLLTADVATLEDALADGEEFQVTSRPLEWDLANVNVFSAETTNDLGPYKELIALECKHKRVPTIFPEKELNNTLTKMYRSAKTSLEENGASTLYLALGLLRWFEKKTENAPARYAPIVLVPIEIIRKSASKGYTMRMRDEDAQINITMLEFLKQNYDIVIGGLNPIPTDDHGIDINKIFAIVRHAIIEEQMWDVIESGFIGNFSFSQFVMWNDIHSKTDFLEKNKIVRSLMKGAIDWDCTMSEDFMSDEAYLPITADASQLRAINMAANDVSFVLHGPPGTGKSQTITAMIANALTKGKTVLFVAEKMAALEVVQKRLEALGIGDFCLELHSNKATKKSVLDQLKRGLEIGVYGFATEYDSKISEIREMKSSLDAYSKALHQKNAYGKSLREMIDMYEEMPECEDEVSFDQKYVSELTQSDLSTQKHILERLIAAAKEIGHPHNHPLHSVRQTEYSQNLRIELKDVMTEYLHALEQLEKAMQEFTSVMNVEVAHSKADYDNLARIAKNVISASDIPAFLMNCNNIDVEFIEPFDYMEKQDALNKRYERIVSFWNENFLKMDMSVYRRKYDDANKKLFGKNKALAMIKDEIQCYAKFTVEINNLPMIFSDIELYQREKREVDIALQSLNVEWRVLLQKYTSKDALSEYKNTIKAQIETIGEYTSVLNQLEKQNELEAVKQKAITILDASNELKIKEEKAMSILLVQNDDEHWLTSQIESCKNIMNHEVDLKDYIVYRQFEKEAIDAGLEPICNAYEKGLKHEDVLNVYLKSIYKAIILYIIENEPALNGFTGIGFNERIVQFKKLDEEFMDLTKDEMYYKLTHNLPSGYESVEISKELNILRRAISSNGRGVSIRALFEQIPNVLKKLCPCMLMSPISVAQYLSTDVDPVDIVIFDEASQLPTCKAVGVLARGKNAVIVGDPNQMPPTSFFAGNTVDEDNLDIEDLESILDDCLALGMPQSHLQWHYRSKHESLIAFSNHEFYENGMLTFPSRNDREKRVKLEKVDGYFDRGKGRVNQAEAEAIVKEIKRRYADAELKDQSVGVVTFNVAQQTLIEDMLTAEFQKDIGFDEWANNSEEKLFVKNLENVQGDERDVILFSIAFGADSEGKLTMNFGPLNREGGWKRLNVAVSRARYEMIVYTIMTPDMIDLRRTKAKGVEALKNFLEFAQNGKLSGAYAERDKSRSQGIMNTICSEISRAGYEYQIGVGHSSFKIDIAVTNPYNPNEYLLGIMLDGDSYKQSKNTKDREVSQLGVLGCLGWDLYRIWTMDWWDNREKEIHKLITLLGDKKKIAQTYVTENVVMAESAVADERTSAQEDSEIVENSVIESVNEESMDEVIEEVTDPAEQFTKVASFVDTMVDTTNTSIDDNETTEDSLEVVEMCYSIVDFVPAIVDMTPMATSDYVEKGNVKLIVEKANAIIDVEAPISQDRLIKKLLRSFDIGRSSTQTIEATEKALKKINGKTNRQNGMKFYWKKDQNPDTYCIYRNDTICEDTRNVADVSQQELKNAVCCALLEKGVMTKDELLRETVKVMGYKRTTTTLLETAERGLKYGKKTGEIVMSEDKKYELSSGLK